MACHHMGKLSTWRAVQLGQDINYQVLLPEAMVSQAVCYVRGAWHSKGEIVGQIQWFTSLEILEILTAF